MLIALGPVTVLITSSFYVLIATHHYWCYLLEIPAEAKAELQFWCNQLVEFNGQDIYHNPSAVSFVFSSPVILLTHVGYMMEHSCHVT